MVSQFAFEANTFECLYRKILEACHGQGEILVSRTGVMYELIGSASCLYDVSTVFTTMPKWRGFNSIFADSLALHIWNGNPNLQNLSERSKKFLEVPDSYKASICATYGPKFAKTYKDVYDEIQANPMNTRRAISHINVPSDWLITQADELKHLEFPCTLAYQWLPRNGRMNLHVHMRSQCAFLIFPLDVWIQVRLMQNMAEQFSMKLGKLTHSFGSLHLMQKHIDKIPDLT